MTWRSDKESKGFNRKTIHKIVASDGALNSKIAFVGEAPGEEETRQGIPFVGSAGKLFSKIMATAGLRRSACYITNVIKERPNKNNIKQFVDLSKKHPVETSEYKEYIKL
jgi:DNA polymerase